MLSWSEDPNNVTFERFLDDLCISDPVWDNWIDTYPDVNDAYRTVLRRIGILREEGMANRIFDNKTYGFIQRYYSKTWRAATDEDYERRKALNETAPEHSTVFIFDTLAEDLKQPEQLTDSVAVTESTDEEE